MPTACTYLYIYIYDRVRWETDCEGLFRYYKYAVYILTMTRRVTCVLFLPFLPKFKVTGFCSHLYIF